MKHTERIYLLVHMSHQSKCTRSSDTVYTARLQRSLSNEPEAKEASNQKKVKLQILRMTREEMAFRAVPLMTGGLGSLTAAALDAIPLVRTTGLYGAFTLVGGSPDQQWVVSGFIISNMSQNRGGTVSFTLPLLSHLPLHNFTHIPKLVCFVQASMHHDRWLCSGNDAS